MKEIGIYIMNTNTRLDYFVSKHYEFLHQLGFLFCVSAMLVILYLTITGMDITL
jgi:hypothetical protein